MNNLTPLTEICFSKFTKTYSRDGVVALFHSLNFATVFTNLIFSQWIAEFSTPHTINQIKNGIPSYQQEEFLSLATQLFELGILVTADFDNDEYLSRIRNRMTGKPAIGVLYLLLTDQCNFRCNYCFIEQAIPVDYKFSYMTSDIAKAAIDIFSRHCEKSNKYSKPAIIFYGGEPLLNKECFKFALEYISECKNNGTLPAQLRVSMVTNGSQLTPDLVEFMKKHDISISVSIDGPQQEHDSARVLVNGGATFDKAYAAFNMLKDANLQPGVSCTIGKHNLERLETINRWFVDELDVRAMGYNLPMYTSPEADVDDVVKFASEALIRCYTYNRTRNVYEDRIMRKVSSFVERKIHVNDCAGCGSQFVISPDGSLGICHAYVGSRKYFIGNVNELIDFNPKNHPAFVEWSKRSPLNMSECWDCNALGICGGGCPYSADVSTGSIWGIDQRYCTHSLQTLEWLIWDLYSQITSNPV